MNIQAALDILQLDGELSEYNQKDIDTAYRRQCRRVHPDSLQYDRRFDGSSAGENMERLGEAREVLLSGLKLDIYSIKQLWDEEKQQWFEFGDNVLKSGCLWDDTKDFPMEDLLQMIITSPVIDSLLTKAQESFQYNKKDGTSQ